MEEKFYEDTEEEIKNLVEAPMKKIIVINGYLAAEIYICIKSI